MLLKPGGNAGTLCVLLENRSIFQAKLLGGRLARPCRDTEKALEFCEFSLEKRRMFRQNY